MAEGLQLTERVFILLGLLAVLLGIALWLLVMGQRRALKQMKASEARLQRMLEGASEGFWDWDLVSNEIYWNREHFKMVGLDQEASKVDYAFFEKFLLEEDRERVNRAIQVAIQEKSSLSVEFRFRRTDGTVIDCQTRVMPYEDATGRVVNLSGMISDISGRKRIQSALRNSEARFRQLSDANLLGIAFWNIYGKIFEANDTFLRTLGYQRTEVETGSVNWQKITLSGDQMTHAERVQKAIQGEKALPYETRLIHKDGHQIDVLIAYAMLEGSRDQGFVFVLDISERKQAEQALRESEQRFRFMAEAMPQKVWTAQPNGEMNYMNNNWFEYTGLNWEALRDFQWLEIVHPDDRAETLRIWHEALETKKDSQISHRLRRYDGDYRWHLSRGVPSWHQGGQLVLWVGTSTDIDDLKQTQASLVESEERFRSLADNVPVLIWLADGQGRNSYTNKACTDFTGSDPNNLERLEWLAYIYPDDRENILHTLETSLKNREGYRYQCRIRRYDDEYRWMQVIGIPRFTSAGVLTGYVGSAVDITEQKEMNRVLEVGIHERTQQLQQSNNLLSSIIDNVPLMIFLKDAQELRYRLFNKAGKALLGLTEEQLIGKSDHDFFPPDQVEFFIGKDRETLSGGKLVDIPEEPLLTVSGELIYLHTRKVPILDEQGAPAYLLGISEDITEMKKNQEEIQSLNRQLEEQIRNLNAVNKELESFSYSVSHDLRAPLRTIDGFSQAILEDYGDRLDEDGKRYLSRVREGSQYMARLIDDMLNLSRLTRGELRKEEVDLSDIARTIVADLRSCEPDRQVQFLIQDNLRAEGDKRLLRAVLENLLGNAWKFTSHHPTALIEFGMTEQEGRPVYYVRDDGAGFDMAYADKLFGAFQRLHNTTEFSGTGVGLASVQRVIHRHGGDIWAHGEVEKGATFYFTLS